MKKFFLINIWGWLCLCSFESKAQLSINNGVYLTNSNNTCIVVNNLSLINNGALNHTNGTVKFTGNSTNEISGKGNTQFYTFEIAKSQGVDLSLQRNIGISKSIIFTSGLIDLNGFDITLSSDALLVNENENSRIHGNNGKVKTTVTLNAPNAVNPCNLGAVITSTENPGTVMIQRGHQSQVNGLGTGNSVLRYYDITPTNNSQLKATLRFKYFDAELNGLSENDLVLFKSTVNNNWTSKGYSTRDATFNYVEKTNLPDFSRWTLSTSLNALGNSCLPGEMQTFYADTDGDGYGNSDQNVLACSKPDGYATVGGDCNDNNAGINPAITEVCNGADDDCDGFVDETCTTLPTINITDALVYESQGVAQVTVSLSSASTGIVKTSYKTVNGTATQPKDYSKQNGEITFNPGETSKQISITIAKDNKAEADEWFELQLSNPVNAAMDDSIGRITISEVIATTSTNRTSKEQQSNDLFSVMVSNNPATTNFIIDVQSSNNDKIDIVVTDVNGRTIEILPNQSINRKLFIGSRYSSGLYFAEVKQGSEKQVVKLIKL